MRNHDLTIPREGPWHVWVPGAGTWILLDAPSASGHCPSTPEKSPVWAEIPSGIAGVLPLMAVGPGRGHTDPYPDMTSCPSCLHRDLLPFPLRLPQAILEASSFADLKSISNLGLGKYSPLGSGDASGLKEMGP